MDFAKRTREELIIELEGAHREIAELKMALAGLQGKQRTSVQEKSIVQDLLNATTEGSLLIDASGKILAMNRTLAERLGKSISELVGRIVYDFVTPEVAKRRRAVVEEVFRTGKPIRFEDERSGRLIDNNLHPIFDERQRVEAVAIFAIDVTEQRKTRQELQEAYDELDRRVRHKTAELEAVNERLREEIAARKETERALRASEERYRAIFAKAPVGISVADSEGRFISVNKAFCDMLGRSEDDLTSLSFREITFPPDLEVSTEKFRALAQRKVSSYFITKRYVRKDGKTITVRLSAASLFDQESEDASAISVVEDITERTRVSNALKESQKELQARDELFRTFMNNSPVLAFIKDEAGRYVYVNRPWEDALGRKLSNARGKATQDVWPLESALQLRETDEAVLASDESMEFVQSVTDPSGRIVYLWVCKFPIKDAYGNKYVGGVALDITRQKNDEKALRESEEKYRLLVETMNDGVGIADADGFATYVNDRFPEMIGIARNEILGRRISDFMDSDSRNNFVKQFAQRKKGEAGRYEVAFVSGDGLPVPVILSSRPLFDEDGTFRGALAVATNIAELKQVQERLLASLKEKDVLLQEVHHRVKNNLQLMLSLLRMQSRRIEEPKILEVLRDAENRVFSIALVHEKLYLSPTLSTIRMGPYVKALTSHVVQAYQGVSSSIELVVQVDELTFSLDTAIPLGMILTELVSNVFRHAFPAGAKGRLHVALRAKNDDMYELCVADTGVGSDGQRDASAGQSLGLDLVKTFTAQLEGQVEIENGEGMTVRISFRDAKCGDPRADEQPS